MRIAIKFNTWDDSHDLKNLTLQSNKGVFTFIAHSVFLWWLSVHIRVQYSVFWSRHVPKCHEWTDMVINNMLLFTALQNDFMQLRFMEDSWIQWMIWENTVMHSLCPVLSHLLSDMVFPIFLMSFPLSSYCPSAICHLTRTGLTPESVLSFIQHRTNHDTDFLYQPQIEVHTRQISENNQKLFVIRVVLY